MKFGNRYVLLQLREMYCGIQTFPCGWISKYQLKSGSVVNIFLEKPFFFAQFLH
jgi:hypothetical protein